MPRLPSWPPDRDQDEATVAPLIVIEGIDGSGKGTQAQQLTERLTATGRRVRLLSFPRYRDTLFGHAIGDFLNGRFGQLNEVHPFLASVLYAADRFESKSMLNDACNSPTSLSAIVTCPPISLTREPSLTVLNGTSCCGRLSGSSSTCLRCRPLRSSFCWMSRSRSQRNIAAKKPRNYTDKAADLQEADAEYLQRVRDVYLQIAARDPLWRRVDSARAGQQRSIAEISDDIFNQVLSTMR